MKKDTFVALSAAILLCLLTACGTSDNTSATPSASTATTEQLTTVEQMITAKQTTTIEQTTATSHEHIFGEWVVEQEPSCTAEGVQSRNCNCGEKELQTLSVTAHIEAIDAMIIPTCTEAGLSEGKHCAVCHAILTPQTALGAFGHNEAVIPAMAPTCIKSGLTDGKRCSRCHVVLAAQEMLNATGKHTYSDHFCEDCGAIDPDFSFPSGQITTKATVIETEYCIIKLPRSVYVVDYLAEKVDILCRALEEVSGLKFRTKHYGQKKVTIDVRRVEDGGRTGESELGNAYAMLSTRSIVLSPGDLFISDSYAIAHELAHILQNSQSSWSYHTLLNEGFAEYTAYKVLVNLHQTHPEIAYALTDPFDCISNINIPDYSLLYAKTMEEWMAGSFTHASNNDYSVGFRLMWYLDTMFGSYSDWFMKYEEIDPFYLSGAISDQLELENQITAVTQAYGATVFDDFYTWLKENEALFDASPNPVHVYDLSHSTYINLYPTYSNVHTLIRLAYAPVRYQDLYINLECAKKYLTDYKGEQIDDLVLVLSAPTSINYYDKDGTLLMTSTDKRVPLEGVSYIRLNGNGVIKNLHILGYADYTENGIAYGLSKDGTYYRVNHIYGDIDSILLIPSSVNGLPMKTVTESSISTTGLNNLVWAAEEPGIGKIVLSEGIEMIENRAFTANYHCVTLVLPHSLKSIGAAAFGGCMQLSKIYYDGTMAEWDAIEKANDWDVNINSYTVICTDGTVASS